MIETVPAGTMDFVDVYVPESTSTYWGFDANESARSIVEHGDALLQSEAGDPVGETYAITFGSAHEPASHTPLSHCECMLHSTQLVPSQIGADSEQSALLRHAEHEPSTQNG